MRFLRWNTFVQMCALVGFTACSKPPVQNETPEAVPVTDEPQPTPPVQAAPAEPSEAQTAAAESEELNAEAPEEHPESATVKLKLDVSPRSAKPVVWWGKQNLGEVPITIERPRRSGPMNIVVKANGYLDHHTRLFTDRDDKLAVMLVRPGDAVGLLGFKRKPGMGLPLPDAGASSAAKDAGTLKAAEPPPTESFAVPQGVSF